MRWSHVDCSMAGIEPQRRATNVWTGLFDRLVTRWRFALGARRALGAEPGEAIVGDVSTTPEALAVREQLLEAAGRYGIQLDEAATPVRVAGRRCRVHPGTARAFGARPPAAVPEAV